MVETAGTRLERYAALVARALDLGPLAGRGQLLCRTQDVTFYNHNELGDEAP